MLRVCVLLVFVCVLGVGSLRGRGLFCRDPDTGKLHAVNTTWPATSFCGNYHCKIRRKNLTGHVYAPLRQVNITNLKLIGENFTLIDIKDDNNINKDEVAKNIVNVDKKTEPDIIDGILNLKGETGTKLDDIVEDSNETEQDRYLSEKEIRSLTEMLHTVKKSDLDAIVEIYNLAQDIYKEIDKTSTDHVLEDIMHTAKTVENKFTRSDLLQKVIKQGHVSYWYEPLASGKVRAADLMRPDMSRTETMRNDMIPVIPAIPIDIEPPVDMVQVEPPKLAINTKFSPTPSSEPYPANQMRRMTDTLLTGPLITHKDFGKLPYYYPMSNFQRMASYQHDPKKTYTPSPRGASPQQPYKAMTYKPMYTAGKYQKEIQKSILLPYPFSNIHHYNWSHPQNMYHRNHLFEDKESLPSNNPNPLSNPNTLSNLNIVSNPNTISNLNVVNNQNTQNNLNALNNPNALKKQNTLNNPNTLSINTLHILNALKNANTQNNVNSPNKVNNRNALNNPLTLNIPNTLNILNALKNSNKLKTLNTLNNLNVLSNPNTLNILNVLKNPNALKTLNLNAQSNPITLKKHIQKPKNAVLMNPDLENFQDLEIKATNKEQIARSQNSDDRRKPDWQTDSLPKQILEEVRAHIQEKQRVFIHPFPLRKKVKLERVGKVHKMDEVKRTKRQVEGKKVTKEAQLEPELFEVFIGNTTCNSDYTVPGFFRYGNLSQPFPECCPQRIQTR
ncbi:hypothetical protein B5X24_HaOG208983 [Helicoverpa armigera]|uniref:Uncharacterized protein n=1 Tax=Helicoverpa armigera TaxID=29058 RepID=A0A2W1BJ08_HELAM|nr:hypothetical protein B5X24_HaOG208983 [Helicoverpa armigera]